MLTTNLGSYPRLRHQKLGSKLVRFDLCWIDCQAGYLISKCEWKAFIYVQFIAMQYEMSQLVRNRETLPVRGVERVHANNRAVLSLSVDHTRHASRKGFKLDGRIEHRGQTLDGDGRLRDVPLLE